MAKVLLVACFDERQVEQVTAIVRSMHKDAKTLFTLWNQTLELRATTFYTCFLTLRNWN
jgi:hypothetical protein